MTLLLLYGVGALAVGALAIWRTPRLPRYNLLLLIAAVPQIGSIFSIHIPGMFAISVATVAAWVVANWSFAGVPLIGAGVLMNMVVMALHGGAMPIRADVLANIGQLVEPGTRLLGSKDIAVEASALWFLSDWMTIRSSVVTIVASPGDLVVVIGLLVWLLFSQRSERETSVLTLRAATTVGDSRTHLLHGQSSRPTLTRLALLAAASPAVAESLLRDPMNAAAAHPHYTLMLDARDRETLDDLRARSSTVNEFLSGLADVVDGAA